MRQLRQQVDTCVRETNFIHLYLEKKHTQILFIKKVYKLKCTRAAFG